MLLQKALDGAASQGAQTETFHLYDLDYKGCVSCFACKTRDGKSYGRCAVKDGLTPLLGTIEKADAFVLGSPIYYWTVTGEIRSFPGTPPLPLHHVHRSTGHTFPPAKSRPASSIR